MGRPVTLTDLTPERGPRKPPATKPDWRYVFLKRLAETGIVSAACDKAKISRQWAYKHRERFPNFRRRWDEALEVAADLLEIEARRRAFNGVKTPVWYRGATVGHEQKYSDALLMFLLRGARPEKYGDKAELKKLLADVLSDLKAEASGSRPGPAKAN
jgi:hypothetical protein